MSRVCWAVHVVFRTADQRRQVLEKGRQMCISGDIATEFLGNVKDTSTPLCKAKRQHLLTSKVSRCCRLALHGSTPLRILQKKNVPHFSLASESRQWCCHSQSTGGATNRPPCSLPPRYIPECTCVNRPNMEPETGPVSTPGGPRRVYFLTGHVTMVMYIHILVPAPCMRCVTKRRVIRTIRTIKVKTCEILQNGSHI